MEETADDGERARAAQRTDPRPAGLHVHVAERADALVEALANELAAPPDDPFAEDLVAVPTRGVERWVAQRLAHRLGVGAAPGAGDGVCAHVRFASPARVVAQVLAGVTGVEREQDPWRAESVVWDVLEILDERAGEPWLATVARHVGAVPGAGSRDGDDDEVRAGRRFHLAQRLAHLLTAYDARRPALVRSWTAGGDDDGTGQPLAPDLAWQPVLWRALVDRLGPPPAVRLEDAAARLVADPGLVDLPPRLHVFGPTALPAGHLRVLSALAHARDVHLWLPQPSLALWSAVGPVVGDVRRRELPAPARHPLLRSMATDATELAARVGALAAHITHVPAPPPRATVLGALQARVRADTPADGARPADDRVLVAPGDRSVQVHACHGRSRQVEVLRDVVVGLLADDPTLEPRDVLVMCPDVEAFAPLVHAVLGPAPDVAGDQDAPDHPGRTLRVRIADRSPARTNPVLAVLETLLGLADSRVTASAVVDLAGAAPVRRRFAFDDDALDRLRAWALESGVHWGEDVGRRARFRLGAVAQGTWSAALDRLLLGVTMAEQDARFVGAVLPIDDVGSSDVALVGRVAEMLDRLAAVLADLTGAHPAAYWCDVLDRALTLLTAVEPAHRWQELEAAQVLTAVRTQSAGRETLLRLPDVVALVRPRLAGRPTRAGFRTGALTVCSMAPMRAVPHRVVVLLGMDDGAFPRAGRRDGDDVLARDPLVGEHDRRQEDRQLFLDAVMAATDHLVVLHTGADERTGARRPPCVPVGELLDAVDDAVALPGGARGALVVEHPLQPVDPRVFTPGALGRPGPFGFDALDLTAARTAAGPREPAGPLVTEPLPPDDGSAPDHDLDDLIAVLQHPPRAFVVQRLDARLPRDTPQLDDRMPLAPDALTRWGVGDRLLSAALDGADLADVAAAERRRGHLPPRDLGAAALDEIVAQARAILETARPLLAAPHESRDVRIALAGGEVTGTVRGVRGHRLVNVVYSRLAPKHLIATWVQLLALSAGTVPPPAAGPGSTAERVRVALTIGRGTGDAAVSVLRAPEPEHAAELLTDLLAVHDEALQAPVPLLTRTSHAYAAARWERGSTREATQAARRALGSLDDAESGRGGFERVDPYHVLAWGDGFELDDLLGEPTPLDRALRPDEPTRFGALASRVWRALLEHERYEEAP